MDDAPLLPEHWEDVRRGLHHLYVGFFLTVIGLGAIGFVFLVLGQWSLARTGPTAQVRSIARARLGLLLATVVFGAVALLAAFVDAAAIALAAVVLTARLADLALWHRTGRALAAWAGSTRLDAEWRRVPRNSAVAVALCAVGVIAIGIGLSTDDQLSLGAFLVLIAFLPVVSALPLVPLLFTSWRTYRLFSTPLVPTAPTTPPPPAPPPPAPPPGIGG